MPETELPFCKSLSEKEPSAIKKLQVPRMANDIEVSSAFPVTMVNFTTTQLLARGHRKCMKRLTSFSDGLLEAGGGGGWQQQRVWGARSRA